MDMLHFISKFVYRIRYKLIFGPLIITALVAYFSQFITKKYTVNTSVYTGIASGTTINGDEKIDWFQLNNTFDNLINLLQSKGTLEKVSIRLLAQNLIYGDSIVDNMYLSAKNYRELRKQIPDDVLKLINKKSLEESVKNLTNYTKADPENYLYTLFNDNKPYYSFKALSQMSIKRLGNSDIVDISFSSDDPGIAYQTAKLLNEQLVKSYDDLRYEATNDVIDYYEQKLSILKKELNQKEKILAEYNTKNEIINYAEQTKALTIAYSDYEDRYEEALKNFKGSSALIKQLEEHMNTKVKLLKTNAEFINILDSISTINGKITEIETFSSEASQAENQELIQYRKDLLNAEKQISILSDNINEYKSSKEGVSIDELVSQWLKEMIHYTKSLADLEVLNDRKKSFEKKYNIFSPVGTQLKQMERDIQITENSYLEIMHGLNMANLKQKNIQLTSASLHTITPPVYPLLSDGSKRLLLTVAALFGSFFFILGTYIIIELTDHTLRDADRTRRFTKTDVLGAFNGWKLLKYRGYTKACNRISAAYLCNQLNNYLVKGQTSVINLISMEAKEGKSFIASYLSNYWKEAGLKVVTVSHDKDFRSNTKQFIEALDINDIVLLNEKPDILLIEYAPLSKYRITSTLLRNASVNLLIANACRVWKESDSILLNHLKNDTGHTPLFTYLNNASRETVEEFIGELPPFTAKHKIVTRLFRFGFTAKGNAVK